MTGSAPKKARIRGPKKPPELFESPYAEQLKNLYKSQKFKGRPPENSVVLLGKLVKAGHFPWLRGPMPDWVTSLIVGGTAYEQYLDDSHEELARVKRHLLAAAACFPGTTKKDAGIQSGISRRTAAKKTTDSIASEFQTATQTLNKKPDAFDVATWHVRRTELDLSETEKKRQVRNLTKRLRGLDSAI